MSSPRTEPIHFFIPTNAVENPENLEKFKQKVLETAGERALAIKQVSATVYGKIVPILALTIPLGSFGDNESCNILYDRMLREYLQETLPPEELAYFQKERKVHTVFERFVIGIRPGSQSQKI